MTTALMDAPAAPRTDFLALEAEYGARNYKPLDVVLTRGEGVYVWDVDGNRYLDCLSAYSAVNQGHCHPQHPGGDGRPGPAPDADLARLPQRPARPLLRGALRAHRLHKVLPMNSGAEAVESAIKVARKWGYEVKGVPDGQAEIIVCRRQLPRPHHGRRRLLHRPGVARRLRPLRAGLQGRPLRRRRGAGGGDHAQHRRLPGRADPGRGGRDHPARRLPEARRASSARATTSS